MKILLAHKLYELTGGAEVFFHETERVLRDQGHETLIVATGEPTPTDPENLRLLKAPAYDTGGMVSKAFHLPSAIYDRRKGRQVRGLIEEFRPDLMHIFAINVHLSPSIVQAAHDLRVPVVATFNDYKHICPNYKLLANGAICFACKGGRFYNATVKTCCKGSLPISLASTIEAYVHQAIGFYEKIDHMTFSSDFMAHTTADFWSDRNLSWSKLRNPFNSLSFIASADSEPFGLFFGRLIEEKGVDRLIDAASQVGGYPIRIIGDGPDLQKLSDRVRQEGLTNVEFLGPRWGEQLNRILSRARFVIVPSVWHENFPYVINQAFAYGRPVIGSRRGGITELVEDGLRGLVFDPDVPGDLAACIRRLAIDDDAVAAMGRAAKDYSDRHFNDEAFSAELMHAYQRGLDAHRRRRW